MSNKPRKPDEFDLIRQAFLMGAPKPHPNTSVVNGDDASVHAVPKGMELVVSTDMSISGVHWPENFPLEKAADRAVCAALSDLAAMGAEACWAWLSVMSGSRCDLIELGDGVNAALARYSVELAGGDLAHSRGTTALSVTVAGVLPKGKAMCRDKAKKKDRVWMIGKAGFSSLGLKQWMAEMDEAYFKPYFETIKPKLDLGVRLRELGVQCCIDVSDGVLQDAGHISEASGVGMELELSDFPGWDILCHKVGEKSAISAVVGGGEDYALIFTAPEVMGWLDSFATCIGKCSDVEGVEMLLNGEKLEGLNPGYNHFE
ncbi:MAG: thiamine-phosphate kinase [Mariprofundaceae bacterium]